MQSQSPAQGAIASLQDQTAPTVVLGFLPFTFSPLFLEAGVPAQLVSGFNTSQSTGEALPQGNSASVSTPAETAKLLKDLQFQQAQAGSSSQTIDAPQDTAFLSNNDGTCQGFGQTSPSTVDPFTQLQNGTAGEIEAEESDSNQDLVSALSKDQNDNRDQQTNKHQEDIDAKNDDEEDNLSLDSKDNDTRFIGEAEKGAEKQKVLNAEDKRTQKNEERRLSKENISPSDRSARSSSLSSADDDPENPYESQAPSRTQDSPPKQADEEEYIKSSKRQVIELARSLQMRQRLLIVRSPSSRRGHQQTHPSLRQAQLSSLEVSPTQCLFLPAQFQCDSHSLRTQKCTWTPQSQSQRQSKIHIHHILQWTRL
jgi:hypothetical protein